MKVRVVFVAFVLGLALGIAGTLWAPQYLEPYVPTLTPGKDGAVEGTVVRKQLEAKRLLLTLSTSQGAVLAIFKNKIAEIDLLVDEDDIVTFRLRRYEPFVDDPPIQRVQKKGTSRDEGEGTLPLAPPQTDDSSLKPFPSDESPEAVNQENPEPEPTESQSEPELISEPKSQSAPTPKLELTPESDTKDQSTVEPQTEPEAEPES